MSGLGPQARRLLELGKDAGEPDQAALVRSRAQLMRQVGCGTAVVATVTTVATTAKAAPLSAALAAAPAAAAPAASIAALPLVATPLVVKVAATLALVVGVGAASAVYRPPSPQAGPATKSVATSQVAAVSPLSQRPSAAPAIVSRDVVRDVVSGAAPPVAPPAGLTTPAAEQPPSHVAPSPVLVPGVPPKPAVVATRAEPVAAVTPALVASTNLANDIASLRAAQAALVAGDPRAALEAADRVQPGGPLSDEREGLRALAGCAMGSPDAREQAARFVERRPQAPLATRVRAACSTGQ